MDATVRVATKAWSEVRAFWSSLLLAYTRICKGEVDAMKE